MKLTGHKTEAVYRRYAIVREADLSEGLKKLARLEDALGVESKTDLSHTLATLPVPKPQFAGKNMAEGASFELADPLRGLRFQDRHVRPLRHPSMV